ncbi:hypothetical protein [Nitratiruptor sp. YY09-18]|uniref:hypothetical protein n=1 Tax=Nitratiruptor sp. YY09-18 TaxID=2724901 RepID=UPI001915761B|nr:hypothetical protein [Nitratiruptor sp. YY09-18]BCD67341.1 hypothetical protein NitYY0918_C0225 [Nitratiruptor sp. YY09-18]
MRYIFTAAVGFDQAGGSILYGQENFTISSYTYYLCTKKRNQVACHFMRLIDLIFGQNHCKRAYHWEIGKNSSDLLQIKEL